MNVYKQRARRSGKDSEMEPVGNSRYSGNSTEDLERLLRTVPHGPERDAIAEELTRRYTQNLLGQSPEAQASYKRQPSAPPTYDWQRPAPPPPQYAQQEPIPPTPAKPAVVRASTPGPRGRKRQRPFITIISLMVIGILIYYVYENTGSGTNCVVSNGISCQMSEAMPVNSACRCEDSSGQIFNGTVHH